MSKPKIVRFDFGSSTGTSELQNKNKKEKEPDNLILVDAFWVKDGMKIRFIPHQLEGITLIVVFALEHDDETHDREKAVFGQRRERHPVGLCRFACHFTESALDFAFQALSQR